MSGRWNLGRCAAVAVAVLIVAACGGTTGSGTAANPTPSPVGATLSFNLHGVNSTASGTAKVTPDATGKLTIEVLGKGLQGGSSHVSHVHVGSCESPGGIRFALAQVIADSQGNADATTTVKQAFPPAGESWYVVVHQGPDLQGSNAAYLLCGNLK